MNQAETEELAQRFLAAGFRIVSINDAADAYVINTCTVTHIADRKSRQIIRQAKRSNPAALIAATGCYVNASPDDVQNVGHIDLLVNNKDKPRIAEIISEALGVWQDAHTPPAEWPHSRTRSFIKIEDGCNKLCSFCIVPLARGRERSVPPDDVIRTVNERVALGHKEVVLTGVHIGAYGKDLKSKPRPNLNALVEAILTRTNVSRLRLSSIEPMDFTPEMLAIWRNPRVCRHVHLPLQSGSDTVLKRMRRRYTAARFAEIVAQIREAIPDVAITTDIIVGFPGETDDEFQQTYCFAEEVAFAGIHVFKYSPRRGTLAATMPDQVPYETKKARSEALIQLATASSRAFAKRFIGQVVDVLYESEIINGSERVWEGLTDNYLRVHTASERDLANQICRTELLTAADEHVIGRLSDPCV